MLVDNAVEKTLISKSIHYLKFHLEPGKRREAEYPLEKKVDTKAKEELEHKNSICLE